MGSDDVPGRSDADRSVARCLDALSSVRLNQLHLAPTAFGGSYAAADLGEQHALATAHLADTLDGVVHDLRELGQGVAPGPDR